MSEFDDKIQSLMESGKHRDAINYAQSQAAYCLSTAAGIYLSILGEIKPAIELIKTNISLEPNNFLYYANMAHLLCKQELFAEALKYSQKSVELKNPNADAYYNHGIILKNLQKLKESAEAFRKARDLDPECAITHCHLGNVLLALGQFPEGLKEDEWRFKAHSGLHACRVRYKQPDWDGKTNLEGKRIVVFNEQGHGDAIQFVRYVKKLKDMGAYVILEMHECLLKLFKKFPNVDEVVRRYDNHEMPKLPEHDYVISIGSLPYIFDPTLDDRPLAVPYLFPEGEISIPSLDNCTKKKIGIVWAGSQWHSNDKDRSCFLKYFGPLFQIPNVEIFSLQQGDMNRTWTTGSNNLRQGDEEIEVVNLLEGGESFKYTDLSYYLKDFNDTALVLQKLDLLISVDTSVAHIAGALGKNVWLLLPFAHEWRWLKKWYLTMKIYRQPSPGDWRGLLELIGLDLKAHIA